MVTWMHLRELFWQWPLASRKRLPLAARAHLRCSSASQLTRVDHRTPGCFNRAGTCALFRRVTQNVVVASRTCATEHCREIQHVRLHQGDRHSQSLMAKDFNTTRNRLSAKSLYHHFGMVSLFQGTAPHGGSYRHLLPQ